MSDALTYKRSAIITMLRDLEVLVVSLDRIGSSESMSSREADRVISEFVIKWDVFRRLAHMRYVLSEPFSHETGEDGMDELERELQGPRFWGDAWTEFHGAD